MLLVPPSTHRKGKPDPRLADLQRMRAIATLLLVLMTTIFIVTTGRPASHEDKTKRSTRPNRAA